MLFRSPLSGDDPARCDRSFYGLYGVVHSSWFSGLQSAALYSTRRGWLNANGTLQALICLAASGFVLYFFRDPVRVLPEGENTIVSPADGRIIRVEEVADNRFLHGQALKVSIFMNLFNVHVNRIPYAGTVEAVRLQAGRFYAADRIKAELHNEYCARSR